MVKQSDLKYCWQVTPDSYLIRWYRWIYEPDTPQLTFCRLFWGTLFSPFVAYLKAMVWPLKKLVEGHDKKKAHEAIKMVATYGPPIPKHRSRISVWGERVAEGIGTFFDTMAAGMQVIWSPFRKFHAKHKRGLEIAGTAIWGTLLVSLAIAFLGGLAFGFYVWQQDSIQSMAWVGGALAFVVGAFIIGAGIAYGMHLLANRSPGGKADKTMDGLVLFFKILFWPVVQIAKLIGRSFKISGAFFGMGYYTIKTRTCPRVEVVEELDHA